jgi:hypothetical protein
MGYVGIAPQKNMSRVNNVAWCATCLCSHYRSCCNTSTPWTDPFMFPSMCENCPFYMLSRNTSSGITSFIIPRARNILSKDARDVIQLCRTRLLKQIIHSTMMYLASGIVAWGVFRRYGIRAVLAFFYITGIPVHGNFRGSFVINWRRWRQYTFLRRDCDSMTIVPDTDFLHANELSFICPLCEKQFGTHPPECPCMETK